MKKILIIPLLALLCLSVKAQSAFTGIGLFKLGTDTSVLYNYAKQNNEPIKVVNSDYDYINNVTIAQSETISRLNKNPSESDELRHLSKCPFTKEFCISEYTIDSIPVREMRLTYYKDILTKVTFGFNIKIVRAISAKYGEVPYKKTYDTCTCVYKLTGIQEKHVGYTEDWSRVFGNVTLNIIVRKSYNNKCEETLGDICCYQYLSDELLSCEKESIVKPKEIKKENLKDF